MFMVSGTWHGLPLQDTPLKERAAVIFIWVDRDLTKRLHIRDLGLGQAGWRFLALSTSNFSPCGQTGRILLGHWRTSMSFLPTQSWLTLLIPSESILEVSIYLSQPSTPTYHYPSPGRKLTFSWGYNPDSKAVPVWPLGGGDVGQSKTWLALLFRMQVYN